MIILLKNSDFDGIVKKCCLGPSIYSRNMFGTWINPRPLGNFSIDNLSKTFLLLKFFTLPTITN